MSAHKWDVTPKEAIEIQKKLRAEVDTRAFAGKNGKGVESIKTIAGADISMNRFSDELYAGIIVLSYPDLVEIEHAVLKAKITFPYVPGLLSFREIPALLDVWNKLLAKPDVVMVDGQGIAHPRRLGIAAHFGLVTGAATLGVAKHLLTGVPDPVADSSPGTVSFLRDKKDPKEIIGALLYSKVRSNPLIVSPGNKMNLDDALHIVKGTVRGYKLPEPTRQAHLLVNRFRRGEISE